jgi:prevent-host-death family protein
MNTPSNQWQLQEAKNKLSQLVKEAGQGFPQYITVHGKSTAVVLSIKD